MTYLIIQIPAFNEEETLEQTIRDLPKNIDGFNKIEILVINDGSSDTTSQVAKNHGAHHVLELGSNRGLAYAFAAGLRHAIFLGADVIVNTDADNQYDGSSIVELLKPIREGKADIVIGARPVWSVKEFSFIKKLLQWIGSAVIRRLSGQKVTDAPSGFRAYNIKAAKSIFVLDNFTYTLDSIIQARSKNLKIISVPIKVNPVKRKSRLMTSTASYVGRSILTIFRIFFFYHPFKLFSLIALPFLLIGSGLILRFLFYFLIDLGELINSFVIGIGNLIMVLF